jgi:hypothetical protein
MVFFMLREIQIQREDKMGMEPAPRVRVRM